MSWKKQLQLLDLIATFSLKPVAANVATHGTNASVGTNVFAGKLIGSGVNPDDLSTTMKGIDAAQTARGGNNISTLLNAGSAISASKEAYTYARENDCDAEVLSNIADNNT